MSVGMVSSSSHEAEYDPLPDQVVEAHRRRALVDGYTERPSDSEEEKENDRIRKGIRPRIPQGPMLPWRDGECGLRVDEFSEARENLPAAATGFVTGKNLEVLNHGLSPRRFWATFFASTEYCEGPLCDRLGADEEVEPQNERAASVRYWHERLGDSRSIMLRRPRRAAES